jgi:hypothetical protein
MNRTEIALNRLTKWRMVFAGWQLGTRAKGDPESDAVRDHREVTIILRAEVTALTAILIQKGICTAAEINTALADEAELLNADYARRFPGFTATDDGMNLDVQRVAQTTKGWRP